MVNRHRLYNPNHTTTQSYKAPYQRQNTNRKRSQSLEDNFQRHALGVELQQLELGFQDRETQDQKKYRRVSKASAYLWGCVFTLHRVKLTASYSIFFYKTNSMSKGRKLESYQTFYLLMGFWRNSELGIPIIEINSTSIEWKR